MTTLLTILQFVVSGGLITVAILSCRDWLHRRDDLTLRYQALAIGSLGVVSFVGRFRTIFPSIPEQVLSSVSLVAFFLSGYGLWLLRGQIIPSSKAARYVLPAILLATAVFYILVTELSGGPPRDSKLSAIQLVATLAIVAAWITCVIDPAVLFWLAARRRNSVQRARLRAVSGDCPQSLWRREGGLPRSPNRSRTAGPG